MAPGFKKLRFPLLAVSVVLYLLSLSQVAFQPAQQQPEPGGAVLALGILSFFCLGDAPFAFFAWLANLALFCAWGAHGANLGKLCRRAALISIALASGVVVFPRVPVDENGTIVDVASWGPGFYLWLASMFVALAAAWLIPERAPTPSSSVMSEPNATPRQ
jgi:hypothetical protein